MSADGKETLLGGQTAGFVLIAIGFAVIAAIFAGNTWLLVIPIVMIEGGVYGIALGLLYASRGPAAGPKWGTDPAYTMFWGSLLGILGVLWLVNDAYPNNLPALAAGFLIWLGLAVMLITKKKTARARLW